MIDIRNTLAELAHIRPIFHSEADFQHALAWQIREMYPGSSVRLEYRPKGSRERVYLDGWISMNGQHLAIELKYKTRAIVRDIEGEKFELLNQSAQDIGRYDFLKDVERLENVVSTVQDSAGCAVLLTNDQGYWRQARTPTTVDANFRLHEGRIVTGSLAWLPHASKGTMDKREAALMIRGEYPLQWSDFSSDGQFRFLLLEVTREGLAGDRS